MCGFKDLNREKKLIRANEIINSTELKQTICNQILGTTFKDVERAMISVIDERQITEVQQEELDLQNIAPHKFDDFEIKIAKKIPAKAFYPRYREFTLEETVALLALNDVPVKPVVKAEPTEYQTYSREKVEEFMREHFEYEKNNQQKVEICSSKTTESDIKTASKTKRSKSTKASKT